MDDEDVFHDVVYDEENKADIPTQTSFASLEDMMESEEFNKPIRIQANKSIAEVIIMIIKYALIYSLSLTGITDLFMIVNCISAEPVLPNTRYLIDKLFYPKNCIKLHASCTKCGAYIGQFQRKDCSVKCHVCQTKIDVKNYIYKDFFVTMDASSPISKLIESNSEHYEYITKDRVYEKGCIRDIYDGKGIDIF